MKTLVVKLSSHGVIDLTLGMTNCRRACSSLEV